MAPSFAFRARSVAVLSMGLAVGMGRAASAPDLAESVTLFKSGRYLECADMASMAIAQRQYSETWRILNIRAEFAVGRYAEALAALDKALLEFPTSVRLRWLGHRVCLMNTQPERAQTLLNEIDDLVSRATWRYRDSDSCLALGHYYLHRGMDAKQVLDATFNRAKKDYPEFADAYLAAGELALEKHDYELAAEELEKALKLDATNPEILLGLAQAYAANDAEKTQAYLEKALDRNPNHVETLLFLADAHIDAERYAEAEQLLLRVFQVNPLDSRAWAYRAVLAYLRQQDTDVEVCRLFALAWWDGNPEVDHLIGKKISAKYRFAEGAAFQRRALALRADYLPAKIQLSQDLLRLGQDGEGWQLAADVYGWDGYNIVAHNLVTLHDHLAKFRVLKGEGLLVRMDAAEADIYGHRVVELLQRARTALCAKYRVELKETINIELFPRQEDFAIRTFGLPGGEGFLGVCFGRVITANSPASQAQHPVNWQSVLWHEFCHAVTLQKTQNRMPRWLSEGISVYEEKQANATWGQSLSPQYRECILGGGMTPVSQLSGAFLDPPSPLHLEFAYFQSALVVEFIVERYGLESLQHVLDDLSRGVPINESLQRHVNELPKLDAQFAEYATQRAMQLAPQVDWRKPDLPPNTDAAVWATWLKANPSSFWGLTRYAQRLLADKKWEAAKTPLRRLLELYPQYVGSDNAYGLLAGVYRELGEREAERETLRELAQRSSDAVTAYLRLMELEAEREDWEKVLLNAERMLAVNPLLSGPHRFTALAAEKVGDPARSAESLRALLRLDPFDPADLHYRLACALERQGHVGEARRHLLQALEEAPRYRTALRKLLEMEQRLPQTSETGAAVVPANKADVRTENPP